jgi:hypothetical protein
MVIRASQFGRLARSILLVHADMERVLRQAGVQLVLSGNEFHNERHIQSTTRQILREELILDDRLLNCILAKSIIVLLI